LKIPAVAVANCSVAPPKAPRRRSSKSVLATADETTSSGIQPTKTKSLESSKRKSSEQLSDAELQAASSLARMSRKKFKKAVKKVVSSEIRRVPSAFDDNLFM
jgi:tRNA uridine 5-carbamoylmethylation protein Kti12